MKLSSNVSRSAILLLLLFGMAAGQEKPFSVITTAGDSLEACVVDSLTDSIVYLTCGSIRSSIPVDSIRNLVWHRESHFWAGAGIGAGAGAVVGFAAGYASYKKTKGPIEILSPTFTGLEGAIIIGVPAGFIVGGIIGAVSGSNDVYNLSQRSHKNKMMIIRLLLSQRN